MLFLSQISPRQELVDSHVARVHAEEPQKNNVLPGSESGDSTPTNSQERDQPPIIQKNQVQNLVCRVAPQIESPRPANYTDDPQPSTSMPRIEICQICNMVFTN